LFYWLFAGNIDRGASWCGANDDDCPVAARHFWHAALNLPTTAILVNLPGEASSAVTAIDGYKMARQGRAGTALAIAAIGSFIAGTIATAVVVIFSPPLSEFALRFGPPEYFSLIVLGLILSVTLATGSVLKALAMIILGLLFGLVGADIYTGLPRFTFGQPELMDGINFVAFATGIYGISEILANLEGDPTRKSRIAAVKGLLPSVQDMKRSLARLIGSPIALWRR